MVKKIILPFAGKLFIYSVCSTMKIIKENFKTNTELINKYGNIIYAFWHGRLLLLLYSYRNLGVCVMTSQSADGDLITRIIESFGFKSARGSSTRGGLRGLIGMKKKMEEGSAAAITVDGPTGPRYVVKEGIIYLAAKMNVPIIPITTSAKPCMKFSSWDQFLVPIPFSKGAIVQGNPFFVKKDEDYSLAAIRLKVELDRITKLADNIAGNVK